MARCRLLRVMARGAMMVALAGVVEAGWSQGASTAFTYQGELATAGVPVDGVFDLRFRLFDAAEGGMQVGSDLCVDDLSVSSGRFATVLDFGAVFGSGGERYLEVLVREGTGVACADGAGMHVLTPRQEVMSSPRSGFAAAAGDAGLLGGLPPGAYRDAANLSGVLPGSSLAGSYGNALVLSNEANVYAGDGGAIRNLNAASIGQGTLSAARMPADWAAGGDLSGLFPAPVIAQGVVSRGKLSEDVQRALSVWSEEAVQTPMVAVAWGAGNFGTNVIPALPAGMTYQAVAAGGSLNAAIRSDGTVVTWGHPNTNAVPLPALPEGMTYVAIACSDAHCAALRSDGRVFVAGNSGLPAIHNVPTLPEGQTYTAIAAGRSHCLAIRSDGQVVAWGWNLSGECIVPTMPAGTTCTAVAGGDRFSLALLSDGSIVGWGERSFGEINVPPLPVGVVYTSVAAGFRFAMAIRSDGMIAAWGSNLASQLNVPVLPAGTSYSAIACGEQTSFAIRSDGRMVVWGNASTGLFAAPALPRFGRYVKLSAFGSNALAMRDQRHLEARVDPQLQVVRAGIFAGSGSDLTDLDASRITTGMLENARTTASTQAVAGTIALRDSQGDITATKFRGRLVGLADSATSAAAADFATSSNTAVTAQRATNATTADVARTADYAESAFWADRSGFADATYDAQNATLLDGAPSWYYTHAGSISTGTLSVNVMPTGGNWNLTGPLTLKSNALAVANSGYVGIGTASPQLPLHVAGAGYPTVQFESSSPTGMWLNLLSTGGGKYWRFISSGSLNGEGAGKLLIGHGTGQGANTVTMTLTDANNVGIGITNPTARLHVAGNGAFTGSLSKGGGSFKIDHPLDPKNKYLYHSFVESPDMMNVYNGVVTLDSLGQAQVELPDYFEALNRDYRYQLTCIGGFAPVYISQKVAGNSFAIAGGTPGLEVSWQVTGIRQDAWAQKNRIPNSVEKPGAERGKLLHPEAFGEPESSGIQSIPMSRPSSAGQ